MFKVKELLEQLIYLNVHGEDVLSFQVMRQCWCHCPEDRPSFRSLKDQLVAVSQGLLAD